MSRHSSASASSGRMPVPTRNTGSARNAGISSAAIASTSSHDGERADLPVLVEPHPPVANAVGGIALDQVPRHRLLEHLPERPEELVTRAGRKSRPPGVASSGVQELVDALVPERRAWRASARSAACPSSRGSTSCVARNCSTSSATVGISDGERRSPVRSASTSSTSRLPTREPHSSSRNHHGAAGLPRRPGSERPTTCRGGRSSRVA